MPVKKLRRRPTAVRKKQRPVTPPIQPSAVALKPREMEVLVQIVAGLTNAEIGLKLGLGYETIKTYVNRLRTKLGASTKTQLAVLAIRHNLVKL